MLNEGAGYKVVVKESGIGLRLGSQQEELI